MAPRSDDNDDAGHSAVDNRHIISNEELMPNAAEVKIGPAKSWGVGFIDELRATVGTHWFEEMTNLNQRTIAVSLLMYLTVIAPTLTFGSVYGTNTGNKIGAVETILATSWTGVFFSLFGGMPTIIVGPTGPILIMTTIIYDLAETLDVPFLSYYAWVSVWCFFYCTVTAFFDLTRYLRLATRFTDDIFALLIVSIFILNAIGSPFNSGGLLRYLDPNKESHEELREELEGTTEQYSLRETAFLSIILGLGTTSTIFWLRGFKTSRFLCNEASRTFVYDFAVTSAVIIWTIIHQLGFPQVEVQVLNVPNSIEPTFVCCTSQCDTYWPDDCEDQPEPYGRRTWFANMGDMDGVGYGPYVAIGPAFLCFVLFYLDNGITWHLIYNPGNNHQHGESYNWDLFLNGFCNMINGMLGLPWLVASTVPCMVHLNTLAEKDETGHIVGVQETRLTSLFSHMLVGFSLLFLDTLKKIPLPVLLGVFLFMGMSSIQGIQFWQRFLLFFQQPSKFASTPYTKYMKTSRIHLYTCLQLMFFAGVFVVQNTKMIGIMFPFMTMLCIPGRLSILPQFFKGWELLLLDGNREEIDTWIALREDANTGRPKKVRRMKSRRAQPLEDV